MHGWNTLWLFSFSTLYACLSPVFAMIIAGSYREWIINCNIYWIQSGKGGMLNTDRLCASVWWECITTGKPRQEKSVGVFSPKTRHKDGWYKGMVLITHYMAPLEVPISRTLASISMVQSRKLFCAFQFILFGKRYNHISPISLFCCAGGSHNAANCSIY